MAQTTQSGPFPITAVITDARRELHTRRQLHWSHLRSDTMRQADGNEGTAQTQAIARRLTVTAAL